MSHKKTPLLQRPFGISAEGYKKLKRKEYLDALMRNMEDKV